MEGRYEAVNHVLEEMRRDNPGLDAVAVVSSDGMPVVTLMSAADELKVSAMAATLQGVAEQVIKELRGGELRHVIVTSEEGTLVIKSVSKDFVLVMLVRVEAKIGFSLWQAEQASLKIAKILSP
ncbi:MAG: roadblock/LC7 domain-containing protein [Thermofilaceae archaeon]|nr:roadblock/LC7 domain-containing protein [Thermofilaceae archaeon]MDW8003417.1 roadblock/LC7 domain-containing protein [Thermofilaceae archaeon]